MRKEIIKKKQKEQIKTSTKSPAYPAITKLQADTTKILRVTQPTPSTSNLISPLPDGSPTKKYYCMMFAHKQNEVQSGSFNTTLYELFRLNNMPRFTIPHSPPSADIPTISPKIISFAAPEEIIPEPCSCSCSEPPPPNDKTPTNDTDDIPPTASTTAPDHSQLSSQVFQPTELSEEAEENEQMEE